MERLKRIIAGIDNIKILDVATGEGAFLDVLTGYSNLPSLCVGVDQNQNAIDRANEIPEHQKDYYQFAKMSSDQLKFEDESFDVVSISNSLHHLDAVSRSITEVERVLKPEGYFIVQEMINDDQNEQQMTHVLMHHFWGKVDTLMGVPHRKTYSREALKALVSLNTSFEIVEEFEINPVEPLTAEVIKKIESAMQTYLQRAQGLEHFQALEHEGLVLMERLHKVGFQFATECVLIMKKTTQ